MSISHLNTIPELLDALGPGDVIGLDQPGRGTRAFLVAPGIWEQMVRRGSARGGGGLDFRIPRVTSANPPKRQGKRRPRGKLGRPSYRARHAHKRRRRY